MSVVAPPGYGKTTLLSQWAERYGQSFAWVSVDEADNDPKVLLSYVAEALDAVEPIGERVFDALASPASSVPGSVVPRLASAFSSMTSPVVLVLDDVHVLRNSECRAALSVLADHVPGGSRLVLAGRAGPVLVENSVTGSGLDFHAAGRYSLSSPPRCCRRRIVSMRAGTGIMSGSSGARRSIPLPWWLRPAL